MTARTDAGTLKVPAARPVDRRFHTPAPLAVPAGSRLARFFDANRRFCHDSITPRFYALPHTLALDVLVGETARAFATRSGRLLEFGCGVGAHYAHSLAPRFEAVFATDIEEVDTDGWTDGVRFARCSTTTLPFDSAQFDLVVACSVIEHLTDPSRTFHELSRVMKPGARLCMNLPNAWDYVSLAARVLGHRKRSVLRHVVRMDYDDFPVFYRCNSRRALEAALEGTGLAIEVFRPLPSAPVYLGFFVPLYVLGLVYQFLIGLFALDFLQPAFIVKLRKL